MPDWTYRTVFRPILFRLPGTLGRDLTLAAIGTLGRLPGGRSLIEFMGHMRPPRPLRQTLGVVDIDAMVGLGPGIDQGFVGLPGLGRFGFGFVEVGPVTVTPVPERRAVRDDARQAIGVEPGHANPGLASVGAGLRRLSAPRPAIIVRLPPADAAADDQAVIGELAPWAAAFSISLPAAGDAAAEVDWPARVRRVVEQSGPRPVLVVLPANALGNATGLVTEARAVGAAGVIVGRAEFPDHAELGAHWLGAVMSWTRRLRTLFGGEACLIAAAGVHAPGDAERLVDAGADLVAIDSGLVFTGPGLAKRCNELLLTRTLAAAPAAGVTDSAAVREKWPWTLVIGASMFGGGLMALVIACTRVIMPYDEAMSGLTRAAIGAVLVAGVVISIIGMTTVFVPEDLDYLGLCAADLTAVPGLVPLVAHDRGTFGGMLMVAGLTMLLAALWGFRRGAAWLWWTFVIAGTVGYAVAIAVHHAVDYVDAWHLAPAYGGLAVLWLAAAASRAFLCARGDTSG